MKIIRIDAVEIEVNDKCIIDMMECITMETNQEILIRNKKEARKLSKQIVESAKQTRKEKYLEALEDNNRLYLNSIYESLSIWDLLKIAVRKAHRKV